MDFGALLAHVRALLQRHRRVSDQALRLRCRLDDESLAALPMAREQIKRTASWVLEVVDPAANHIATQVVCRQAARDLPLCMRRRHSSTIVTHPPFASVPPLPPNF